MHTQQKQLAKTVSTTCAKQQKQLVPLVHAQLVPLVHTQQKQLTKTVSTNCAQCTLTHRDDGVGCERCLLKGIKNLANVGVGPGYRGEVRLRARLSLE